MRFLLPMVLFAILLAVCIFVVPVGNSMRRVSETKTTVVFVHQPTGTVDLHWNPGTEQLTVTIHLNDLTPLSTHPAHIHQGTCQMGGAILFALKPVVANTLGVGTSQTIIPHVTNGIPARDGLSMSTKVLNWRHQITVPIACTAIGNVRHRPSVLFDFNPTTAGRFAPVRMNNRNAPNFDPLV